MRRVTVERRFVRRKEAARAALTFCLQGAGKIARASKAGDRLVSSFSIFGFIAQTVCLCAGRHEKRRPEKTGSPSKATADAPARPFPSTRPPDSKQVRAFSELCNAPTARARLTAARSRGRAVRTGRLAGRFLLYAFPIAEPSGHEKTDPNIAIETARDGANVPERRGGARDVHEGDSWRPQAFPLRFAPRRARVTPPTDSFFPLRGKPGEPRQTTR